MWISGSKPHLMLTFLQTLIPDTSPPNFASFLWMAVSVRRTSCSSTSSIKESLLPRQWNSMELLWKATAHPPMHQPNRASMCPTLSVKSFRQRVALTRQLGIFKLLISNFSFQVTVHLGSRKVTLAVKEINKRLESGLTMCLQPVYYYSQWQNIVLYVEAWRAQGASRFIVFYHSATKETRKVLEYYQNLVSK